MKNHANQLKFVINEHSDDKLATDYEDRVCEAFFEAEKMWYAALI